MNPEKISILIVENDPSLRELIDQHLQLSQGLDFKFVTQNVSTLMEATSLIKTKKTDIVLLDLSLPDSQGIKGVKEISELNPEALIIVLGSIENHEIILEALRCGAKDFLIKETHFDRGTLLRSILSALESVQLLRKTLKNEQHITNIIQSSKEGMLVVDINKQIFFANPAAQKLLGQPLEELKRYPFVYPIQKGLRDEFLITVKNENGEEERTVEMFVTDIEWEEELAYLVTFHDITDIKKVEHLKAEIVQWKKSEKLKDEFISTVSHELRTPLAIIKGAIHNLTEGVAGSLNEKQNRILQIAFKNINRLTHIINGLLDLSRLESGKAKINRTKVSVNELINDVTQSFEILAKEKGVTLTSVSNSENPSMYADLEMVGQVMHNLLSNALRYSKSTITVESQFIKSGENSLVCLANKDSILISVKDDGPGIPPEKTKDLFNKFVQIKRLVQDADYKGTGLGLAICLEIIGLHGGRIWVENQANGGAQFYFLIPSYNPLDDLQIKIEQRAHLAREKSDVLSVVLIRFIEKTKANTEEENILIQNVLELIEKTISKRILREKDELFVLNDKRQMVILANTAKTGLESLKSRITDSINTIFSESKCQALIQWLWGQIIFPDESNEPDKLLERAQEDLKKEGE